MKRTQIVGAFLSIGILILMYFIPESIGLSSQGIYTLGVLIAIIIALITEPLPLGITCMLGVPLMVVFGVVPTISDALKGYTNHILFFVLVSFGISEAITKVPISRRMLKLLIKAFGTKSKNVLLAFMLCAAVLSSIMSNVATTAVFVAIILDFMNIYENPEERKRSGKAFLIALPIASMIGGMMTPAGTSLNLLGMDYLAKAGIEISFIDWMFVGIPIAMVTLFFSWWVIYKVFKPAEISGAKVEEYLNKMEIPHKMEWKEKYVLVVVCGMFVLWILSSWVPALNVTVVGTIGFSLLFLPKISVLKWKEYTQTVSWASFFLIGTMMSLGSALSANGVSDWIINLLFSGEMKMSSVFIVFLISIIVFLLLLPIPIAPVLISMLGAPFVALSASWGISPLLLIMPLILCASNCFLLPLDTVPLLTYATGYYKMSDMPKVSVLIQLAIAVCTALWVPIAFRMIGLL